MSLQKLETAFNHLEKTIKLLQEALDVPFLEAYAETIENIVDDYQVRVVDNQPTPEIVTELAEQYAALKDLALQPEEWRKATQILLLKGNRQEPLQANHQLTPDSIGLLFVFLIQRLVEKDELEVLDTAVGMGNLLLTIALNLQIAGKRVHGFGVDVDEMLLSVAAANAELTGADVHYFHQDSLNPLLVDPVDVAVADLPIGYYPNDEKAQEFVVGVKGEHTYAHHLLLEQSMKYVKEAGFGLFLLPSNFIESPQSDALKKWLETEVYLQGMIQLPAELFKTADSRKSIVLLQRRGGKAQQAPEVLLVNLASLKDASNMAEFLTKFEDWKSLNINL
ncbi:site-specific DNA-methyltransferase (adenine-specific) [Enterococcus sp. PF1-24]|uniref:class I SAM-dependent methyltransferase n=1 Tax=unclassified Enterococcus TaxID=2608891 RepID=UPI002474DFE1|nr:MULTISPECIES: class I SAM-dependent methyltransferase [unclassified Enterococcus]MDH6365549.1 site-specific DNA-methyltransferase (adenine-specific) [Enterococcus sp. PFB1-1]MDH6402661.1 site-specific DNA-methyltransferase (adenine-specific) [Enterococcus sp. PF1-24]